MAKISKVEMAKKIVAENANATRKEIVELFMSQLGMSKAGATTYAYNLAKGAAKSTRTKTVAAKPKQTKEERIEMMRAVAAKLAAE